MAQALDREDLSARGDQLEGGGTQEIFGRVAFEGFDGFVFGEAERVVGFGETAAAVFGALPKFAAVFAEEEGLVFLRLVAENRAAAAEDFLRAERDGEVNFVDGPIIPRAAVEPEFGGGEPGRAGGGGLTEGIAEDAQAEAVRAVRVVEIAGSVDQVWLKLCEEVADQADVGGAVGAATRGGVVKRQVEEMEPGFGHAADAGGSGGFVATNERFPAEQFGRLRQWGAVAELVRERGELGGLGGVGEAAVAHEGEETPHRFVGDGARARNAVGNMDLVALIDEAAERAAHGDDVVVGVRREDEDAFGENGGTGAAQRADGGVAGFRFFGITTAGPTGDGVLEFVEADEVGLVGGAVEVDEILEAGFVVVVVGELEDGFTAEL